MAQEAGFIRKIGRRIGETFLKQELADLKKLQYTFLEAYKWGPAIVTPQMTMDAIQEYAYDPQLYDFMLDQLVNYDTISLDGSGNDFENVRQRLVSKANNAYRTNGIVGRIIDLWTDFGFGINVDITPRAEDEKAIEIWEEFWKAPRNRTTFGQRKIKDLSTDLLNEGEVFFAFFVSKLDGKVTSRIIPANEMIASITVTSDKNIVGYWKREYIPADGKVGTSKKTVYYRDWLAEANGVVDEKGKLKINPLTGTPMVRLPDDAKIADQEVTETDVFVFPLIMKTNKAGRGMPLLANSLAWADVYEGFAKDRAAVSKQVAMYVDKVVAKTGQRGLNALKSRMGSTMATSGSGFGVERNPPAVRGSTWLENESATRTRMPLGTGASDAFKDAGILMNQLGIAGSVYPHWLGLGDSYKLATATAMEMPMLKAFQRYQSFWASVWADIVEIILQASNKYGQTNFSDFTADVIQDSIIDFETDVVLSVMDEVEEMFTQGFHSHDQTHAILRQLLRTALQSVGIKDTDELLNPDNFEDDVEGVEIPPEDEEETEEAILEAKWLIDRIKGK